jgi:hypothetical protein
MISVLSLVKNTFYFDMSMINTMLKINHFKRTFIFLLFYIIFQPKIYTYAQGNIPQALIEALKAGNTTDLTKFFNTSIELAILDQEDIYSKQQAELIIKDFFSKHMPTNFVILHKGGKEGSQYAIGNLATVKGSFRVTLLIKQHNNKLFIHQLRFEEGNAE